MITLPKMPQIAAHPFPADIADRWTERACAMGYTIAHRVQDRFHLLLKCGTCGQGHRCKIYTLMTARPTCPHCLNLRRKADAAAVGATFLRRSHLGRHWGVYRLPCAHHVERQFGQIRRAAVGATGLRCEHCLADREAADAQLSGWTRLGGDTTGRAAYRLYRHGCGHEQAFTPGNMLTGRVACAGCGTGWWCEPSFLYLMDIRHPSGRPLKKVGISRDPTSRMRFQLGLNDAAQAKLTRTLRFDTGHAALTTEKRLHRHLRHQHPSAVIPRAELNGWIRVRSKLYDAAIADAIEQAFDRIEDDLKEMPHDL